MSCPSYGDPEGHRPARMARRVVDREAEAGELEVLAVAELPHFVWLGELVLPTQQHGGRLR